MNNEQTNKGRTNFISKRSSVNFILVLKEQFKSYRDGKRYILYNNILEGYKVLKNKIVEFCGDCILLTVNKAIIY